jgi:DNA-binding CsgD family transcriptional regulator
MARTIILYALALAAAATALEWLKFRYWTRAVPADLYIFLIAAAFVALGLWAGRLLTPRPAGPDFELNHAAIRALGLTARECEILALLASGQSNKEMARALGISPNTVKTHLARLFGKLDVQRRVQAIEKARLLALIP